MAMDPTHGGAGQAESQSEDRGATSYPYPLEPPHVGRSERGFIGPYRAMIVRLRFAAAAIDYLLVSLVVWILTLPLSDGVAQVFLTLVPLANVAWLQGVTGRSLGKRWARGQLVVMVEAPDGSRSWVRPGVLRCLVRQVAHIADFAFPFAGLWLPVIDSRHRTVADFVVGTFAVEARWSLRARLPGEVVIRKP